MSIDVERLAVFDVSLLSPESLDLLKGILDEGNLTFVLTREMLKVLREIREYRGLLRLWGINTRYAEFIADFLGKIGFFEKVKAIALEDLPDRKFVEYLRELIHEKDVTRGILADYLADEMCLALVGYPILCTSASRWKIVEFFEAIGARVKGVVHAHLREKAEMIRTKRFRLMVLAKALGAAFVYVLTGPLGLFGMLGPEVISLVIVDG